MTEFKIEVFYGSELVYESDSQDYISCIAGLNDVISLVYSFLDTFSCSVIDTSNFVYSIKEVI